MSLALRITLAQINPIVGALKHNFAKILDLIKEQHTLSDLIVFPELATCGYPSEDLVLRPSFIEAIRAHTDDLCSQTKDLECAVLLPTVIEKQGKIYNAVQFIHKGEICFTSTKHHLPNYAVFDEQRTFESGPLPSSFTFKGFCLGFPICEDLWHKDVSAYLKADGAEILIVPNGSPFQHDKNSTRMEHAQSRAKENKCPILYVNQIGGQDELVFDGGSFALSADGHVIAQAKSFQEDCLTITYEKNDSGAVLSSTLQQDFKAKDTLHDIYSALVLGVRDYVDKNGFPGVWIGSSGGIDSAISAAIAVDALGPERVHTVLLPSRYTSDESNKDAQELAKNLSISAQTAAIEEAYNAFDNILSDHMPPNPSGLTFENLQSRIRGTILMALSNATGHMVLSTGNKSEMATGYATLYGDMNGGFNALKDVYKTQVYALANWRNHNKPDIGLGPHGTVIPERIITKAPTAELRDNQTDQDSLPPYDVLDAILNGLIEDQLGRHDLIKAGHDPDIVEHIIRLLDRAEYKRRQAPPGVKITSRAFGKDRRYPMTNHFHQNH